MSKINNRFIRYIHTSGHKFSYNNRNKEEVGKNARSTIIYQRFEHLLFDKVHELTGDLSIECKGNNWKTDTGVNKKRTTVKKTPHNNQYFG